MIGNRANKQFMIDIAAGSIELGPLPFDLYAPDHSGRLVLFCREGYPITERHMDVLSRRDRNFYICSDDQGAYVEYAAKRIGSIISDPSIRVSDKASIVHSVGKRTVRNLLDSPRSGQRLDQSDNVVSNYVDLILSSPDAAGDLFALTSHDSYSFSHAINVCTFCLLIGECIFGNDRKKLHLLGLGGLLHDIGMTQIDTGIIFKTSSLSDYEFAQIKRHPIFSDDIISGHGLPREVASAGRSHHERLDGSGYPDGLKGDEIHPFARITAVADVYDAITTDRVYRKQRPHIDALSIIAEDKEKYDPKALSALLRVVLRNDLLIESFCAKHGIDAHEVTAGDAPRGGDSAVPPNIDHSGFPE